MSKTFVAITTVITPLFGPIVKAFRLRLATSCSELTTTIRGAIMLGILIFKSQLEF